MVADMKVYEKVFQVLEDLNVDAVLVKNQYNIRYITGYTGDTGCVYISKNKKSIITDFRYVFQAMKEVSDYEIIDVQDKGYSKTLAEIIKEDGCKVLAFEGQQTNYKEYAAYQENISGVELVCIDDELSDLRMVKSDYELEQIKMAEHIGDLFFDKILEDLKPGVTELEIAAKLEYYMKMEGAEGISFDPIVASGINSSMPHAIPSRKTIETGDFVTLDFGCRYNGYCSDMTRTVVIGKATDKQKEIYNTVLKAQLESLAALKAGVKGCEIDKIARDIIYDAGYKGCFGHGLGHSVGLFIHESPRASERYNKEIGENVTMTIEPGIYIKDFGGVRIEDLVVVTKDGYINFTNSKKELIEL